MEDTIKTNYQKLLSGTKQEQNFAITICNLQYCKWWNKIWGNINNLETHEFDFLKEVINRYFTNYDDIQNCFECVRILVGEDKKMTYQERKAKARQKAIDGQLASSENNYDMQDLANWGNYFEKLGKRYGLLKEFRENGIC